MEIMNALSWFILIWMLCSIFYLFVEILKKGKIVINKNKISVGIILIATPISILIIVLNMVVDEVDNMLKYTIPNNDEPYNYIIKYEYDDLSESYRGSNYEVYINDYFIWLSEEYETTIHDLYKDSTLNLKIHYPIYSDGSYFEIDLGSVKLFDLVVSQEEFCWPVDKYREDAIGFCFYIEREVTKWEAWKNIFGEKS